jgi:hypothetical protein
VRVEEAKDLDCAERVEQVGVVADVASEATTLVLAREDKVNHRCSIEILESSDKGESPVRAGNTARWLERIIRYAQRCK